MTASFDTPPAQNRRIAFTTQFVPAVLYAGFVFYAGLIPMAPLPEGAVVPTDKLLHAFVFGGLAVLIARAWSFLRSSVSFGKQLVRGCVSSSLLGALLELCQSFVSYRSSDVWDWVADTIGAAIATGVVFLAWRGLRRGHD